MPDKHIVSLLLAFSLLGVSLVKLPWGNGSINISYSENDKEVKLTASYPKEKSKDVHAYIKQEFHLADIDNLDAVEIKQYDTPDGFLSGYIKSRNGYLKLVLQREHNSREALEAIKKASKEIGKILSTK